MGFTTLAVSTCILWWIFGFITGATSLVVVGLHINKKQNAKNTGNSTGNNNGNTEK